MTCVSHSVSWYTHLYEIREKLEELLRVLREAMQDKESRVHQDIYGISNCGMENEQVYYGLDELEQAKDI